jgi:tRNA(Arg) A34 adenosine deaminase TadA
MTTADVCNCASGPACGGRFPTRRSVVAALACTAMLPAMTRLAAAAPAAEEDERYMRIALEEARRADFPFGAVIVRDARVIARGRNLGRTRDDPTAHGEMVAIRRGLAAHGSKALRGATLYTSGEPCAMCMGAILWCHFGRLVFAASLDQLATRIDQIMISSEELASKAKFAPISITGGVLADEAMALFPERK